MVTTGEATELPRDELANLSSQPKTETTGTRTRVVTCFFTDFWKTSLWKDHRSISGLEITLLETKIAPGNHFTIVQDYPLRRTWRFIWYISISNSRFIYKSWELGGSSWFFENHLGLGQSRQLGTPNKTWAQGPGTNVLGWLAGFPREVAGVTMGAVQLWWLC